MKKCEPHFAYAGSFRGDEVTGPERRAQSAKFAAFQEHVIVQGDKIMCVFATAQHLHQRHHHHEHQHQLAPTYSMQ